MKSLKWVQVNAWRLSQHYLSHRLPSEELVQSIKGIMGVQAQLMSAAEMAIGARVDGISPRHVQSALWQKRTLIKTWAMRAALHLIPAREFPLYIAARKLTDIRNWTYYFSYYGVNQAKLEDYLAVSPEILSDHPMHREEFASIISTRIKSPELYDLLVTKGWGTPLKPLAWRGDLCFGPSQGHNVTFVKPNAWIGEWQSIEPHAAVQEMLRRYL